MIRTRMLDLKDVEEEKVGRFLLTAFRTITMSDPVGPAQEFLAKVVKDEAYIILATEDEEPVSLIVAGVFEPDYEPPSANIFLLYNEGNNEARKAVLDHLADNLYNRGIEIVFVRNTHLDREEAFQRMYRQYGDVQPVGTLYKVDLDRRD